MLASVLIGCKENPAQQDHQTNRVFATADPQACTQEHVRMTFSRTQRLCCCARPQVDQLIQSKVLLCYQEMEKRKQQQYGQAAASARSYFSAQSEAESAQQQAAFDAAQRSRRILEEEKAKDRAWREAVQKVNVKYADNIIYPAICSEHAHSLAPSVE